VKSYLSHAVYTPDASTRRSRTVVALLKRSEVYRDYQQAFRATTGLPLSLRSVDSLDLPHAHDPNQNPFCGLMAGNNHSCAACLQLQRRVEEKAREAPCTLRCFAGLSDSAVPVRVGEKLIGFLQTGQIQLRESRPLSFAQVVRRLGQSGVAATPQKLEAAYRRTRVLERKQYDGVIRLLAIFAEQLSLLSNQLMVAAEQRESPQMRRARLFIVEHQQEEITLRQVAAEAGMSVFHFCKIFRQATGLTFTDYLARLRIERVQRLLLNPHKRISEAAYEGGFQSLSQFNRVFLRVTGRSPTAWRERLTCPPSGVSARGAARKKHRGKDKASTVGG
jgi:AraC-like DNA-binding protein/ligand-binding sensor protein